MMPRPMQRDEMSGMVDAHRNPLHSSHYTGQVCDRGERGHT